MIGIDILHVPRIVALIQRRGALKLASRILSPVELDAFRASHDHDVGVAARFLGVRCGHTSSTKRLAKLDSQVGRERGSIQGSLPSQTDLERPHLLVF